MATTQVRVSSVAVTASEPSAQLRATRPGLACQRPSVARVSSQPWTTASCSAFMYQWIGRQAVRLQRTPPPRPIAQGRNAPGRLEGDLRGHLRLAEAAL